MELRVLAFALACSTVAAGLLSEATGDVSVVPGRTTGTHVDLSAVRMVGEGPELPMMAERIINGAAVTAMSRAPYVVHVQFVDKKGWKRTCSGVLVAADVIVTAGHCFDAKPKRNFVVCGGVTNLKDLERKQGGCVKAKKYAVPKKYKVFWKGYDIAAVKTKKKLTKVGAKIATVSLKKTGLKKFPKGTPGYIRGFGSKDPKSKRTNKKLREAEVMVYKGKLQGKQKFPPKYFAAAWGDFNWSGGNVCDGDSGGPLTLQPIGRRGLSIRYKKTVVIGVLSFGYEKNGKCLKGTPALYSKFSAPGHAKFLRLTMKKWNRKLRTSRR